MKAVVCKNWGPPDALVLETLPDLVAAPGQVVIDVKAAGVNFPDVLIIQNKYQNKPALPFIPGAELSGIVRAVGEGVTHVAVGDAVMAYVGEGAFATQACVSASLVMRIPEGLDFDHAAAFTLTYGTAYHGLVDRGQLRAGETLLVLGAAGGVGLATIEIGKALGARVIAAASTDAKLEVCKAHGADAVINYATEDLRERLKALTQEQGPDVICDPVGGVYAEPAFRSIAWGGRYLIVGFANGDIPRLPLNLPLLKGASLVGVFRGAFARRDPAAHQVNMERMGEWIRAGKLRPHVSQRYSLAQTAQALKDMEARQVTGKIVVVPE